MSVKPREVKSYTPFINEACGADETLVLVARLHWIFIAKGVAGLVIFLLFSLLIDHGSSRLMLAMDDRGQDNLAFIAFKMGGYAQYVCLFMGLALLCIYLSAFMTTTIGLTTRRLMLRRGVLFVKLTNIDLEEIKGEYVDHGMLGRFFNYGEIHMDARFVQNFYVPNIADPYHLLRALNEARATGGDSVVAGEVPLAVAETAAVMPGPPENIYVPAPPVPEILPPEVSMPARIPQFTSLGQSSSGHAGGVASVSAPAPVPPTVQPAAGGAAVITHLVVAPADGSASIVVPVSAMGAGGEAVVSALSGVAVTEAVVEEEPVAVEQQPVTVKDLEPVADAFTENAEPPSQVIDETAEYVIIKKKKPV